jgi:hypothetical protein
MFTTPGDNNDNKPEPKQAASVQANNPHPVVIPDLVTSETQNLRSDYPNIERLESGDVASWLMERSEQLIARATSEREDVDTAKLFTGGVALVSLGLLAQSPLIPLGAAISAIGYVYTVLTDIKQTHKFSPIPFVRQEITEFLSTMGSAKARTDAAEDNNDYLNLLQYLSPFERTEVDMINCHLPTLAEYLSQIEVGKKFYAYRWLLRMYDLSKGYLPDNSVIQEHMQHVKVDSRINLNVVQVIQNHQQKSENSLKRFKNNNETYSQAQTNLFLPSEQENSYDAIPSTNLDTELGFVDDEPSQQPNQLNFEQIVKLPLPERADAIISILENDGFAITDICNNQIIAIAGNQRGGKGTLMGLVSTLMLAIEPSTALYYFTTGVDVFPIKASKSVSALNYSKSHPNDDDANIKVARETLDFFRSLDKVKPGSLSNVVIMVDEVAGILKRLSDEDKVWLLEFWLRAFAKTGATLFLALHASNLTALAGKSTGWAQQFKSGVAWIGCEAESVKGSSKLRPILRATGKYFITDPENFNSIVKPLGVIPNWLKSCTNPATKQPDPVRTMLKIFSELYQEPGQNVSEVKRFNVPETEIEPNEQPEIDPVQHLENLFKLPDVPESTYNQNSSKNIEEEDEHHK